MQHVNPEPLFEMAVAYWRSCVLFSAIDLDIFDRIGDRTITVDDLSTELQLPKRSLRLLIDALLVLELLHRSKDGQIQNSPLAQQYLRREQAYYLGESIRFNANSYAAWGMLSDAVRKNKPSISPQHFLGDDEAASRNFVYAMHSRAMGVARCLVDMLDLRNCRKLLDLGGGPGSYAILLAERFSHLRITVMDLPGIIRFANEIVARSPERDRIHLQGVDIFQNPIGSGYDAVLISGVLHRTEGQSTINFLKKVADAMNPGAILAISDVFVGKSDPGPVLPELFALQMMLTAEEGNSLALTEMSDILASAGFKLKQTTPYPPPLPHSLCLAEKIIT